MSTISFGKVINQILNKDSINQLVSGRVYPLLAPNFDKYPFIVYQRQSLTEEKNKDLKIWDVVEYELIICSDTYENSVAVAEVVRAEMEQKNLVVDEFDIYTVELVAGKEGVQAPEGAPLLFTQSLTYRFRIRN